MMTEAEDDVEPHLRRLPALVLSHLCAHLGLDAVLSLSCVCKSLYHGVQFYFLHLNSLSLPVWISDVPLAGLLRKCPNLKYLDISVCKFMAGESISAITRYHAPNLRILRTRHDAWNHRPAGLEHRYHSLHLLDTVPHLLETISLCVTDVHMFQRQLPLCINTFKLTMWRTHLLPNILTPSISLPNIRVLKFFAVDFEHNAMQKILASAVNLRSLKLHDCGYDDPQELSPLCGMQLEKLEIMHSPISDNLININTSSLIKFGIDWCPAALKGIEPDVLMHMLSRATQLQSLKLSSGSINRAMVDSLHVAKPFSRALIKLQIIMSSTCSVQDAMTTDIDSLRLFALFPNSLQELSLSHFPHTRCIPLTLYPCLRHLDLRDVNLPLESLEMSIAYLASLQHLRVSQLSSTTPMRVLSPSLEWFSVEDSSLPGVSFLDCPRLSYARFQDLYSFGQFYVSTNCKLLSTLVIKRCNDLHEFLLSNTFFALKKSLPDLHRIKIIDCRFCYNDVKAFLHFVRSQLLCALVDFDRIPPPSSSSSSSSHFLPSAEQLSVVNPADEFEKTRVKKISSQISAACTKVCQSGIDPSCPKHLSDVTIDPQLRLVTNFPFYTWLKVLSDFCQNDAAVCASSAATLVVRNWLFLMFRIHDYATY